MSTQYQALVRFQNIVVNRLLDSLRNRTVPCSMRAGPVRLEARPRSTNPMSITLIRIGNPSGPSDPHWMLDLASGTLEHSHASITVEQGADQICLINDFCDAVDTMTRRQIAKGIRASMFR